MKIYEYNNLNQLVRKYDESNLDISGYLKAGYSYSYDSRGNLSGIINLTGYSRDFIGGFDSEGKLVSATKFTTYEGAKTALLDYTYDDEGNAVSTRTRKKYTDKQTDVTNTTIYDYTKEIPTVLAEYSTDGTIINNKVHIRRR